MQPVFEAHLPGGTKIVVNDDGSVLGLPAEAILVNHFVRRYTLCEALLKKCVDAGLVADHEATGLFS